MSPLDLQTCIAAHPARGSLSVELIRAFCLVESNNNTWAYRYEPQYKYLVGDPNSISPTERIGQMISWGLTQVMGGVAREHGFTGQFTELCDPEVGLLYGMKHLQRYYSKYKDWDDAIASYNAGSPRRNESGHYVNQFYVDKVKKAWMGFHVVDI
jgi:hypothetical protein